MSDGRKFQLNQALQAAVVAALFVVGIIEVLTGCSRGPGQASGPASAADTLANGVPRALVPKLAPWVDVWRHAIPQFDSDSLKHSGMADFTFGYAWAGAGRATDGVRSRALVDVLSPDSARSLDFDMYLDFDSGAGGLLGREPDSAPVLADFKRDTVWQVAFCGTSCFYDGAYWVDDDRCAVTGATQTGEQADGPWCAFLEVYDLLSHRRAQWLGPKVDAPGLARYQAAADSALAERLERAGLTTSAGSSTGSRVGLTDQ